MRYTIKTLFILTSIAAALAAGIAWRMQIAERQRRIVDELVNKHGFIVCYRYEFDEYGIPLSNALLNQRTPGLLEQWFGKDFVYPVYSVGGPITVGYSRDFSLIAKLPQTKFMMFTSSNITDDDLAFIGNSSRLEILSLGNTAISDKAIVRIKKARQLRCLFLGDTKVTDRGLLELATMESLKLIDVRGDKNITNDGVSQFKKIRPDVEVWFK